MMELIEITADNGEDFSEYIDEDFQEDLERQFFRGIGALDDDGAAKGAIVYELTNAESEADTGSRVHLLRAVDDEIKNLIMGEYGKAAAEEEVAESFYESEDETLSGDLQKNGFSKETSESPDIIISHADVKRISESLKIKNIPPHVMPLSSISVLQFRAFIKNCLFKGQKGLLDDLAYLPMKWFERDVSSCVMTDDKVDGALLLKKAPSGILYVKLYIAFGPDYKQHLALMMANTARKIVELYPEDTKVIIRRHNEVVKKLTDKLFAGSSGRNVYSGKRKEG